MTLKLPALLVILGLAAGVGLVVGLAIDDEPPAAVRVEPANTGTAPTPSPQVIVAPDDDMQANQIAALEQRLLGEIDSRRELERRLEQMERRLAALAETGGPVETITESETPERLAAPAERGWFDETALLDSGMDAGLANELKVFFEQLELERLYLRDRSAREGWDRDRLGEEMRSLDDREQELRDRLGESAYDAYLYASGQTNRVAVTSVLDSAQAAQAGIQPGDLIIRYDSERIYNWRGLRTATTSGNFGDTVEIEVERDGENLQFYLTRGPLGIRMDSRSVAP